METRDDNWWDDMTNKFGITPPKKVPVPPKHMEVISTQAEMDEFLSEMTDDFLDDDELFVVKNKDRINGRKQKTK